MKRMAIIWAMILIGAIGLQSLALADAQTFLSDELNFSVTIEDGWAGDAAEPSKLRFWTRTDAAVQVDGVVGYLLMFEVDDLTGFPSGDYALAEAWLNENCTLIGGIVTHEAASTGADAVYPALTHTALGTAGDLAFTLVRPETAPAGELAGDVWMHLTDDGRFALLDPSDDRGPLGAFDSPDLMTGEAVTDEYIRNNRLTIANFWGTFCPPCIREMPIMGRLAGTYADRGVGFLGIVIDGIDEENLDLARQFIEQTGANYPHIEPNVTPRTLAEIMYIPTTMFLDSAGQLVGDIEVGGMDEQGWIDAIESRLAMLG